MQQLGHDPVGRGFSLGRGCSGTPRGYLRDGGPCERARIGGDVQELCVRAFDHARRLIRYRHGADNVVGEGAEHRDAVIADQVGAIAVAAERQTGEIATDLADLAGADDVVGASVDYVDHRAQLGSATGHVGDGTVGGKRDVANGQTDVNGVDDPQSGLLDAGPRSGGALSAPARAAGGSSDCGCVPITTSRPPAGPLVPTYRRPPSGLTRTHSVVVPGVVAPSSASTRPVVVSKAATSAARAAFRLA